MRAAVCLMVLLIACGGEDEDGPPYPRVVSAEVTVMTVEWLAADLAAALAAGNPHALVGELELLDGVTADIFVPAADREVQSGTQRARPGEPVLTGTCACDASGCAFEDCADEEGSFRIDGTIEIDGETYRWNLVAEETYADEEEKRITSVTTSGELTIGASRVDGSSQGEGVHTLIESPSYMTSSSRTWSMAANEIELDDAGCPVGGTFDVSHEEPEEPGRADPFYGSGTVTFGPACGDAVAVDREDDTGG